MCFYKKNSDILRLDQTNADALLVRGLCFYYQDNIDRAFLHFKQVLLMAPDHVKARDSYRVSVNFLRSFYFCYSSMFVYII